MKLRPLNVWSDFKKYRVKYYKEYIESEEKGGIRWSGSAWAFDAIPVGLGDDVYPLTGEPYGATASYFVDFSNEVLSASDKHGIARDLCGYLRNYWGSILLNKFILPDGTVLDKFPKPHFNWTIHQCCTHAKWYHYAAELEGGVPTMAIDIAVGHGGILDEHKIEYVVRQLKDAIFWMEKVTGREYDDELLIKAVYAEAENTSLWAKICYLNKNVPAPLDEKSMYTLYVPLTLHRSDHRLTKLYQKLFKEVENRVKKGHGAFDEPEILRVATDSQPPWPLLGMFRYMEQEYGAVSIGSPYTFGLEGAFECVKNGEWSWKPVNPPSETEIEITNREEALRFLTVWNLKYRPLYQYFTSLEMGIKMRMKFVEEFKVDGYIFHLNRGCEGTAIQQLEVMKILKEIGIPTTAFEGNMADPKEIDEARVKVLIDTFMNSIGLKKHLN